MRSIAPRQFGIQASQRRQAFGAVLRRGQDLSDQETIMSQMGDHHRNVAQNNVGHTQVVAPNPDPSFGLLKLLRIVGHKGDRPGRCQRKARCAAQV